MVDEERKKDQEFGARLAALREKLSLSQTAFAKLLGVDSQTVSEWERGNVAPNTRRLRKLVEILPSTNLDLLVNGPRSPQVGCIGVGDHPGLGNMYGLDDDLQEIVKFLRKNRSARALILAMVRGSGTKK